MAAEGPLQTIEDQALRLWEANGASRFVARMNGWTLADLHAQLFPLLRFDVGTPCLMQVVCASGVVSIVEAASLSDGTIMVDRAPDPSENR